MKEDWLMSRELYKKQTWADLPDESTPISAERLTHLEETKIRIIRH